jgi:hypothetical protein
LREPKRLTQKLATQLAQEYRECGAFVEQRLRLLAALSAVSDGNPKPWSKWEKQDLHALLAVARLSKHLNPVGSLVDRAVRNALAHGSPEVDVNSGECRFHDRQETISWSFTKFFKRTRRLTYGARAAMELELIMQLASARRMADALWQDLRTPIEPPMARAPSPSARGGDSLVL